ncbi:MAG: hypothetical protein ACFCVB_08940 [Nodosilinea sp.]
MAKRFWHFLPRRIVLAAITATTIILPAHAELNVSPETITIAGNRTDQISTTLTFSDSDGISTLQTAVSDLRRADGAALIPANRIVIDPPEIAVPADAPAQITIAVNLADASANGEFTGSLYLYYQGGRQIVPLLVKIKAAPLWPWVAMIVGVLLGIGLSLYRADGQQRDEILVKIGQLNKKIEAEGDDLDENYKASIDVKIDKAFSAIEDKNWEAADAELRLAKQRMDTWRSLKLDWLAQLKFGKQEVAQRLCDLNKETQKTSYMVQVKQDLEAVYRRLSMGQTTTPETLRNEFSAVNNQIADFNEGWELVQDLLTRVSDHLSGTEEQFWNKELEQFEARLSNLKPTPESYQTWRKELNAQKDKLVGAIRQAQEKAAMANEAEHGTKDGLRQRVVADRLPAPLRMVLAPTVSGADSTPTPEQARDNLIWAGRITRTVSILLLAGVGMVELYSNSSTFGAAPLRDYFALLAWGFGAEVTRESVAKATRGMGLPSAK